MKKLKLKNKETLHKRRGLLAGGDCNHSLALPKQKRKADFYKVYKFIR